MSEQPFAGIRIIEFGQFVAVPVAAQWLADGGAEVIKVEPVTGDPIRGLNPLAPGESRYFITRNNGKHALPLALSDAQAQPVIHALVASADVVLMNMRPGLPAKLGLDPEELLARFPQLVVGSVSGFGKFGPESADAGMDLVVQARSGLMAANGRVIDGRPAAGDPVSADLMCAMTLAFGISSALLRRERTGVGGIVDTSLLQAAMALTSNQTVRSEDHDQARHQALLDELETQRAEGLEYEEQLKLMQPQRRAHMFTVYYRTFVTRDSHIAVACGSLSLREKFAKCLSIEDPALAGGFEGDLDTHYASLAKRVEEIVASEPSDVWVDRLRTAGVPVSKVRMPIELHGDEQVEANNMFHTFVHPEAGNMTIVAPPLSLDENGFRPGAPTPAFGSEARSILSEVGLNNREIDNLFANGLSHDGLV